MARKPSSLIKGGLRRLKRNTKTLAKRAGLAVKNANQKRKLNRTMSEVKLVRKARDFDNAPNFDRRGNPTPAFKTRMMRDDLLSRRRKKRK